MRVRSLCLAGALTLAHLTPAAAGVHILEHPLPPAVVAQTGGYPSGITMAGNGAIWITLNNGVARYAYGAFAAWPQAVPPEFAAGAIGGPIVQGPDSALYASASFAVSGSFGPVQAVVRITQGGQMTNSIIDGGPSLLDYAFGPDGRLYLATRLPNPPISDQQSGIIVAMRNPGYATADYASLLLPDYVDDLAPQAIARGEDGSMWVAATRQTAPRADLLYRISTRLGIQARFRLPINSAAAGLVWGPDDALWFTEFGNNRIGRLTGTGRITEFRIPSANSGPTRMVTGGDGALWFIESRANKIGRITLAGAVVEYPVPTANSGLSDIAAPPPNLRARTIWFSEGNTNRVGELFY
ncbi:MAG: virginiamycin B lyase [Candidatus Velthaea sp.]